MSSNEPDVPAGDVDIGRLDGHTTVAAPDPATYGAVEAMVTGSECDDCKRSRPGRGCVVCFCDFRPTAEDR